MMNAECIMKSDTYENIPIKRKKDILASKNIFSEFPKENSAEENKPSNELETFWSHSVSKTFNIEISLGSYITIHELLKIPYLPGLCVNQSGKFSFEPVEPRFVYF